MPQEPTFNPAQALGAQPAYSADRLTLYIPDRDKDGVEIGTQRRYVLAAIDLLSRIGGGATSTGQLEGAWLNPQTNSLVWDRPVLVYSSINAEQFFEKLPELRRFLHRMGRETNQGEVALEFSGAFYRITEFDEET